MAARGYSYRITVAPMNDGAGEGPPGAAALTFTHTNHDDVIGVVERVRRSSGLDHDAAAAAAIGLKLLSEVMLKEKGNALFDPLRGGIWEFVRNLKALARGNQPDAKSGMR